MKQISRHLHDLFKIRLTEMGRSVLNVGSTVGYSTTPWPMAPSRGLQHHPVVYNSILWTIAPPCGLQHHPVDYSTTLWAKAPPRGLQHHPMSSSHGLNKEEKRSWAVTVVSLIPDFIGTVANCLMLLAPCLPAQKDYIHWNHEPT